MISTITRNNLITSALSLLLLSACATTSNVKQIDRLDAVNEDPVILIMTPDVKYYLLTAGGVSQPHAEWTEAARNNFSTALREYAKERNINIITPPIDRQLEDTEVMKSTSMKHW